MGAPLTDQRPGVTLAKAADGFEDGQAPEWLAPMLDQRALRREINHCDLDAGRESADALRGKPLGSCDVTSTPRGGLVGLVGRPGFSGARIVQRRGCTAKFVDR